VVGRADGMLTDSGIEIVLGIATILVDLNMS